MKKVFKITFPSANRSAQPDLSIRIGSGHFAYAVTDHGSGRLQELGYFTGDGGDYKQVAETIDGLSLAGESYYQTRICYDYPGHMLVPSTRFRHEDAGKAILMPQSSNTFITELLTDWQLYDVFTVPTEVHEMFARKFPSAKKMNQVGVQLKNTNAGFPEGCLEVDIRHSDISVLATRSGKLLIAQVYEYSTPEDVLYYLLSISKQFSLSQDEVQLSISGLVDKQSALYKELYQYFVNIRFRDAAWDMRDTEYPSHFFTSLNDLSVCE